MGMGQDTYFLAFRIGFFSLARVGRDTAYELEDFGIKHRDLVPSLELQTTALRPQGSTTQMRAYRGRQRSALDPVDSTPAASTALHAPLLRIPFEFKLYTPHRSSGPLYFKVTRASKEVKVAVSIREREGARTGKLTGKERCSISAAFA